MKSYTVEQVQVHNTANDCWIIVDGKVFDVTKFLSEHPGGKKVLLKKAGKDASKEFKTFHNASIMQRVGVPMQIGVIASSEATEKPKEQQRAVQPVIENGLNALVTNIDAKFGENLPYGDPSWYQEWNR
jgi:cytochrome b involved in lipid metabolism